MAAPKTEEKGKGKSDVSDYDAYFDMIQSRKTLSSSLQEKLTAAFTKIPVSTFPQVPRGKGKLIFINSCEFSCIHVVLN